MNLPSRAGTFISDNDGNWGDSAVWNPDSGVPGPGDVVFANHVIVVEANHACGTLHLNKYLGVLSGYTLTIGGGWCGEEGGPVQLTGGGGTLINQGTFRTSLNYPGLSINPGFTWRNQGAFHHSTGTLTLSGTFRNEAGGGMARSGGVLEVHGGWINEAGAAFDVQFDGVAATGPGPFWNRGLLRKSAGAGTATLSGPYHEEDASVEVLSGTLVFSGGGLRSNATYTVAAGAALDLTGGQDTTYRGAMVGPGPGPVRWGGGRLLNTDASFNIAGGLHWSGGALDSSVLENRGLLVLQDAGAKYLDISTLRNRGTIRQHAGSLVIRSYGIGGGCIQSYLVNEAEGLYDVQMDGTPVAQTVCLPGYSHFQNRGTLRKSTGPGVAQVAAYFENLGGTVEVLAGTLVLGGGGHSSNGVFQVAAGATLDLTGGQDVSCRGAFTGTGGGQVRWDAGQLRSDEAVLNFPSGFFWGGGELAGGLTSQGLLVLDGTNAHRIYGGALNNAGLVRHSGAGLLAVLGGPYQSFFHNLTGAVYEVRTDGPVLQTIVGGGGWESGFYNYGTFRKAAGVGVSEVQATTAGGFRNLGGRIEVLSGTLRFANYSHASGTIRLQGGDVALPDFHLQAGRLEGAGVVTVAGTLTSSGAVAPGLSIGTLNLAGHFNQTGAGALEIEIAGRNAGEFDRLAITGGASLNGALSVKLSPTFLPVVGDSFPILACANRSGTFNSLSAPPGLTVSYTSGGVFLVVTSPIGPTLIGTAVAGTNFTFSFQSQWGVNYAVEYNDTLNTPDWRWHQTLTGDGSLLPCLVPMTNQPQRYFRVRQQ
ncbi:MAG: hypothetical protein FJ387_31150 [Verrucomicrobia bacterium]|nr:hypothetical protein [Verrucomicrobiota bacterium]